MLFYPGIYANCGLNWGGVWYGNRQTLSFGNTSMSVSHDSYIMFQNITIPQGAIITSAKLTFYSDTNVSGETCNAKIYVEDSMNPSVPTNITQYNALSLSASPVEWNDIEAWEESKWYNSPDISTIIQELINNVNWVSGLNLVIVIKDNESDADAWRSFDTTPSTEYPILDIEYFVYSMASESTIEGIGISEYSSDGNLILKPEGLISTSSIAAEMSQQQNIDIQGSSSGTSLTGDLVVPIVMAPNDMASAESLEAPEVHSVSMSLEDDLELPMLTISAAGINGGIHTADIDWLMLTISAAHLGGGIHTGDCEILMLTIDADMAHMINLDEELPIMTISAYGYGPLTATLDEELPFFEIFAISARAVAALNCYVLNTRNNALAAYSNYAFNSFCSFNGNNLAACSTGIMLLSGEDDNGTNIDSQVNFGIQDFDIKEKKRIVDAYLGIKGDGEYYLKVTGDNGIQYEYLVSRINERTRTSKTNIGRGLKSRFFELEFTNINGADFELQDIDLNVEVLSRKAG